MLAADCLYLNLVTIPKELPFANNLSPDYFGS